MKALRIKEEQEEKIRLIAISANKKLIQLGKEPLKDSEIAHLLLNEAIERAQINNDGAIQIRNK